MKELAGLALSTMLLLAPAASRARSSDSPPAPFLLVVAGTTAAVTTLVAPLVCSAADRSGSYPLLHGFVYAALGSALGAGLGIGVSYALGDANVMSLIGIPILLGTAGALLVSVGGLTGQARTDDLGAARDSAWSFVPSQVGVLPLPGGLATALAWRF